MPFTSILTCAAVMEDVLRSARVLARTDATLLLTGESGTGKEVFAKAIYQDSLRKAAPFITVNCAALPETLAESLLFGHRKGAFTGADSQHTGLIAAAEGGTVFFDEIGELPMPLQAKLLRFMDSGEILPLGETRPKKINVRVLAATHRNLREQAKAGAFRHDLYYRLGTIPLELPSLRERREDIALLSKHFLAYFAEHHGLAPARLSPEALEVMGRYPWPGNIRELKNNCERLSILLQGRTILPANLPAEIQSPRYSAAASSADTYGKFHLPDEGISLDVLEQELLQQALEKSRQNKTQAAGLLGITRDALNYRLKKYALR
ncbi:MAG: sigma-54 dependent transcriptional regulator [Thiolinea sp.]